MTICILQPFIARLLVEIKKAGIQIRQNINFKYKLDCLELLEHPNFGVARTSQSWHSNFLPEPILEVLSSIYLRIFCDSYSLKRHLRERYLFSSVKYFEINYYLFKIAKYDKLHGSPFVANSSIPEFYARNDKRNDRSTICMTHHYCCFKALLDNGDYEHSGYLILAIT